MLFDKCCKSGKVTAFAQLRELMLFGRVQKVAARAHRLVF